MKSLEKIYNKKWENVVPYAGAWIEIKCKVDYYNKHTVVPYAGAWIEMIMDEHKLKKKACRPLRGDVD